MADPMDLRVSSNTMAMDTHFAKKSLRWVYMAWLALAGLISWMQYQTADVANWEFATRQAILFGTSIFIIHVIYFVVSGRRNWLAPDIMYCIAYYLFHFGYLILWIFDLVPFSKRLMHIADIYPKVMFIVNLGIIGFLLGYETIHRPEDDRARITRLPTPAWMTVGLNLMILALIIHVGYVVVVGIDVFLEDGYHVSAYMDEYVSFYHLWSFQPMFFMLGFSLYLISAALNHGSLLARKTGWVLFGVYFLLLLMEGGRTQLVTVGIIPLIIQNYLIRPIKLRWLICFFMLAMVVFSSVRYVRSETALNPSKMLRTLKEIKESEQTNWYDSIAEMGGSVDTIGMLCYLVPDQANYWYGMTYAQAVMKLVPFLYSRMTSMIGVTPAVWLTYEYYSGMSEAGTGFSIAGEGYLNFGIPGVLLHMFLIGMAFSLIHKRMMTQVSPARALVFFVSFGLFLTTVRNHSTLLVAPVVRAMIVAWLMVKLFKQIEVERAGEEGLPGEGVGSSEWQPEGKILVRMDQAGGNAGIAHVSR